ncbi:hypothetical protein L596_025538 [Steinernema carpocapsae]|uniref:GOLD domain-containing protein n=1 Tax=Steinernema carpocapsae TaxID=34508 RepID=A0A4U5M824_STECR|nr:hypothetical protein L596_025538 [Steinernema carpocapsae]
MARLLLTLLCLVASAALAFDRLYQDASIEAKVVLKTANCKSLFEESAGSESIFDITLGHANANDTLDFTVTNKKIRGVYGQFNRKDEFKQSFTLTPKEVYNVEYACSEKAAKAPENKAQEIYEDCFELNFVHFKLTKRKLYNVFSDWKPSAITTKITITPKEGERKKIKTEFKLDQSCKKDWAKTGSIDPLVFERSSPRMYLLPSFGFQSLASGLNQRSPELLN